MGVPKGGTKRGDVKFCGNVGSHCFHKLEGDRCGWVGYGRKCGFHTEAPLKKCYGAQDSNIAIGFREDCSKCAVKEPCRNETLKNLAKLSVERRDEE